MVALLSPLVPQTSFAGLVESRRGSDIGGFAAALSEAVLRGDRFAALTADHPDTREHILGLLADMLAEHAVPVELREPEEIYHLVDGPDPGSELANWASAGDGDPYGRRPLFVIESAETLTSETIEFLWLASTVLLTGPLAPQILFSGATQFQHMLRSHACRGIREHIALNVAVNAPPPRGDRAVLAPPAVVATPSTSSPPDAAKPARLKWPALAAAVFVCAGMGAAALVYDDAAPSGPVTAVPAPATERPRSIAAPTIAVVPQIPPSPVAVPATAQAQNEPLAPALAQPADRLTETANPHTEAGQVQQSPASPGMARLAQLRVVLQYRAGSADSEAQARQIAASLAGRVASAQIKAVPNLNRVAKIRYFDRDDRDAAIELNAMLSGVLGKARPRHQTDKTGQAPSAMIEVQLPRPPPAHGTAPIRTAHQ